MSLTHLHLKISVRTLLDAGHMEQLEDVVARAVSEFGVEANIVSSTGNQMTCHPITDATREVARKNLRHALLAEQAHHDISDDDIEEALKDLEYDCLRTIANGNCPNDCIRCPCSNVHVQD